MGITPAYAGKSTDTTIIYRSETDHPCVCGEKDDDGDTDCNGEGSPLRMRGKVTAKSFSLTRSRITPAYAGKSSASRKSTHTKKDHPCVCGEKLAPRQEGP